MCYGEMRGMGRGDFVAVWRCGVSWLWVVVFGLGGYARTSHTPVPSREGRFGCLFLVGNGGLSVEDSPLKRGGLDAAFLVGNGWVVWGGFPSREGIKGCVTVRGAVWAEVILLLFGEEVFLCFGWLLWV